MFFAVFGMGLSGVVDVGVECSLKGWCCSLGQHVKIRGSLGFEVLVGMSFILLRL